MDQIKIGRFIATRRKENGMTQMQLADKLHITDRAVSKWETGRALPDASLMLDLCQELHISVNDLLSGEMVTMGDYNEKQEQHLLDMVRQKEETDKRLLSLEIVIGILSVVILLGFTGAAAYVPMDEWLRIVLIVVGFAISLFGLSYAIKIEQIAGYYECGHCHHKYVPTFSSVLWAMHINRTRYMKCPKCGKRSWNKKVITKD